MIAGALLFGLSFIIIRYTKDVKLLKAKLTALKQYLSKYHFRKDIGSLQSSIEKFLIYGVALGISSKVMKEMLTAVPEWQSSGYFAWYAGAIGHGSPAGFAEGASAGGGAGAGGASGGAG